MLLVPWFLFGPILSGIIAATSIPNISKITAAVVAVIGTFAMSVAIFFIFGAAAGIWTFGFSTNFILTKHPAQI